MKGLRDTRVERMRGLSDEGAFIFRLLAHGKQFKIMFYIILVRFDLTN